MNTKFKEFIIKKDFTDQGISVIVENFMTNYLNFLPSVNLDLPSVEKRSKIEDISDFSNPITIRLEDGSVLYFTNDEYRRLHRKPEVGKIMIVKFQRNPNDKTQVPSKIIHCQMA